MIGETILHYKIIEKLGEGGMGVVYKAQDTKLKREVAIKFLPHHISSNDEERKRFEIEAQAAASLNHPSIATIHAIEESGEDTFIVMEFIDGIELKDKIKSGPIPTKEAVNIAIQIAEGLEAAHKKDIVHRDIKSQNIMITDEGKIKIMDFGLAKMKGGIQLTKLGGTVGTVAYMSPEQVKGEEVDHRTDIWSFGVVLYEMFTGQLPFRGEYEQAMMFSILNESPEPVTSKLVGTQAISKIIDRLLQKNPDLRYQKIKEVLKDLGNITLDSQKPKENSPASIAVLSFKDMSPQKDQDYLCEGLAEELINALTKIKTLHVSARTSAFAFKDKQVDIREIGSKLNVETVLEGSVQKSANRLRITAQLINVDNGYHIWSERYDREMKDVFEIQDDITENIVQALKMVLTTEERKSITFEQTTDIEAYEFYLRGRKFFHQQQNKHQEAIALFTKATEIDPNYALAYCGLADCYSLIYLYWDSDEVNLQRAENAGRKAVEINPELAEAHASLGFAVSLKKDFNEAVKEFEKSINLNPQSFEAYYYYGRMCFARGDFEKTASLFEKAIKVRPEDYQTPALLTSIYRSLGDNTKLHEAQVMTKDKAKRHLDLNPDDVRAYYLGAGALLQLGEIEKGEEWIQKAIALDPDNASTLYNSACFYSQINNVDKSIECLQRAIECGYAHKEWLENDSDLDPIRNDPRFAEIISKMK
jgi:serine/threonine protein kinase/Flp pilus assembly protein TadD